MLGTFHVNPWVAAGACTGVILSAAYALTLYRKVALARSPIPKLEAITDLNGTRMGDVRAARDCGALDGPFARYNAELYQACD